jgi:hypothetical protein
VKHELTNNFVCDGLQNLIIALHYLSPVLQLADFFTKIQTRA